MVSTLNIDYSNTDEHIVIENGRDKILLKKIWKYIGHIIYLASFGMVYNINQNYQLSLTYGQSWRRIV
ncbi:MAG: hypothetical protein Ct9H300mP18_10400 [Candidatus Neomarinimicrobiota bacterium]|nr:MAG: hypothetical protein Ct9H300mP18_10400 [Candidatus Neomarinimicrobiota bacterium]